MSDQNRCPTDSCQAGATRHRNINWNIRCSLAALSTVAAQHIPITPGAIVVPLMSPGDVSTPRNWFLPLPSTNIFVSRNSQDGNQGVFFVKGHLGRVQPRQRRIFTTPPCATAKMLMDTEGQTLCMANNRRGNRGRLCSIKRCFCILQIVWSAFLHTRRVFVPKRKVNFYPFVYLILKKNKKKEEKKRLDSKFWGVVSSL